MLLLARRPDLLDQDSAEQIRRREVSRFLRKMDLSPKEEEAIERLSYSLVARLLLGPISQVMACVEIQASYRGRGVECAVSTGEARPERQRTRKEQMV